MTAAILYFPGVDQAPPKQRAPEFNKNALTTEMLKAFYSARFPKRKAIKLHKGIEGDFIRPYNGNVQRGDTHFGGNPLPFACDIDHVKSQLEAGGTYIIEEGPRDEAFQFMDMKYGVTKELLKFCGGQDTKLIIYTRSDLCAHDAYADILLEMKGLELFIMIDPCNDNDELYRQKYPGTPSVKRLMQAYRKLFNLGINVKFVLERE